MNKQQQKIIDTHIHRWQSEFFIYYFLSLRFKVIEMIHI
uniref:Uncharacterized protein n=1 Tax=Anguilla anguilla TaxID=7936 RepID=A0A0E9W3Z3_ANGAN